MLTPCIVEGESRLAFVMPRGWDRSCLVSLRDAMMNMVQSCAESEDFKELVYFSESMYFTIEFIKTLNEELEQPSNKKL